MSVWPIGRSMRRREAPEPQGGGVDSLKLWFFFRWKRVHVVFLPGFCAFVEGCGEKITVIVSVGDGMAE